MNKFEYGRLSVRGKLDRTIFQTSDNIKTIEYKPICALLSELGADGWEIINIKETNSLFDKIFRRNKSFE